MTQTTTDVEMDVGTDLDSLDTSMDKVYVHRVDFQQGATSNIELLALSQITALCGFTFHPTKYYTPPLPPVCPRCEHINRTQP